MIIIIFFRFFFDTRNLGQTESYVYHSKDEFANSYYNKVVDSSWLGFSTNTREYYSYTYRYELKQQYEVKSENITDLYRYTLRSEVTENFEKYLHPDWKLSIDRLEYNYSDPNVKIKYMNTIRHFGTTVIVGVRMGGKLNVNFNYNKELETRVSITQIKEQSSTSFFRNCS